MAKCNKWTPPPPGILSSLSPASLPQPTTTSTPFPLLSLPRELRDQIYTHTFPPSLPYLPHTTRAATAWQPSSPPLEPPAHLALLLTSRQIHLEAQETLFRTTPIRLPADYPRKWFQRDERRALNAALSAFPTGQARLVTRVCKAYCEYTPMYREVEEGGQIDECFAMWARMVSESVIVGSYFPRLRGFDVRWRRFERGFMDRFWCRVDGAKKELGEEERRKRVEGVARVLVEWLRKWDEGRKCVPPVWLRVRFDHEEQVLEADKFGTKVLEDALALAHRLFAKDTLTTDERDASGRQWLEGLHAKRNRKRKGWCDAVNVV